MRILLAIDSSTYAQRAVEFASNLPIRKPIDFDLVSVVAPPMMVDTGSMSMPLDLGAFLDVETERSKEAMEEVAAKLETLDHVHSVHQHVPTGPPASTIVGVAERTQADLVVVGAIGHSAIERVLLGSVSDYVATHASCSALIVRSPGSGNVPVELNKIMLALSGQKEDERMLAWLREMKLKPSVEVHLVRVLDRFTFYRQDLRQHASDVWDSQYEHAQSQILDFETQLQALNLNTETHLVEADHVGDALVEYARQHGCDLTVTGDSDSGMLTRMLLGSTSRYVLRHAECSTLIVRADEGQAESAPNRQQQSVVGA
ncbi:universal stress protein [Rhodopirellula sp. JC740]|uniref:Universal stress protein n=1 Tax=Rhodopirellula halodulae TaxID=2894198 RepID=A0ABS8NH70_9BACT|nr:universal stress protein [Rhodopirellula sp. JC740]MCC9642876.1 universal stress protein [Rhodopirellula sp. JC740]